MDFHFILTHIPAFAEAAWLTSKLSSQGVVFSLIIGFSCVLMHFFKLRLMGDLCQIYIEFSRNTPLLIQLFFLYYALPELGFRLETIFPSNLLCLSVDESLRPALACAIVGLSSLGGAYMAEALKAGFEFVKKQQFEAGLSLGPSTFGNLCYVILPQALMIVVSGISTNIISLIKETSVVSIIALPGLVTLMKSLSSLTYKASELLFMLFMGYLCIILPPSLMLSFMEKRLRYA